MWLQSTKMANYRIKTKELALVGLTGAITSVLGPIAITLPFSPVPVSLGLLGIFLATGLLGCHLGTISCLIYILIGSVGLPVFSSFTGGIGVLLGPTGGYLLGYLFVPLIPGLLQPFGNGGRYRLLTGMIFGLLLCYISGTLWLGYQMEMDFSYALSVGVLPYIPADVLKLSAAWIMSNSIRKRLFKSNLLLEDYN